VIGNSGIRRALAVSDDSQSKGAAHRGIHRGVFCSFDDFRSATADAFKNSLRFNVGTPAS
jgi:hypothetical protein